MEYTKELEMYTNRTTPGCYRLSPTSGEPIKEVDTGDDPSSSTANYIECLECRYMRKVEYWIYQYMRKKDYLGQIEECPGCGDEMYIIDKPY